MTQYMLQKIHHAKQVLGVGAATSDDDMIRDALTSLPSKSVIASRDLKGRLYQKAGERWIDLKKNENHEINEIVGDLRGLKNLMVFMREEEEYDINHEKYVASLYSVYDDEILTEDEFKSVIAKSPYGSVMQFAKHKGYHEYRLTETGTLYTYNAMHLYRVAENGTFVAVQ